jgi:hypothetical protein
MFTYKPGKTADAGTKRKMKEYERAYNERIGVLFSSLQEKHLADWEKKHVNL